MNERSESVEELGRSVRRARAAVIDELGVVAEVERRLTPRPRLRRPSAGWLSLAGLAIATAIALGVWSRPPPPLSFALNDAEGVAGQWIEPQHADAAAVFSDGTTLLVAAGARATVSRLDADGAYVRVERGRVVASVHHDAGTRWLFDVGPYAVQVTGTRFEAAWDAVHERFTLTMGEGSVRVTGPGLVGTRALVAGQTLDLTPPTAPRTVEPPDADAPAGAAAELPRPLEETPPAPARPRPSRPSWRTLADDGDYHAALATAEGEGFERLLGSLSAGELLRLGDVARYARQHARAREAYLAVRERFRGTLSAASAAYSLGLITAERSDSLEWFETYVDEAPSGPLAAEALGRLIEAAAGRPPDAHARALARTYLEHHPDGPHASLARSLLPP
jgi:hypothetical protein